MFETRWGPRGYDKFCHLGGGGGGGYSQTNATQTTTAEPPTYIQPYLTEAANAANTLYQGTPPQYYPGQTVAPMTDAQNEAIQGTINQATSGSPVVPAASNFNTNELNGGYLGMTSNPGAAALQPFTSGGMTDPANNPYFTQTMQSALGQIVPATESAFVSNDSLNNPNSQFAAGQGIMAGIDPMLQQLYTTGTQEQLSADTSAGGYLQNTLGLMNQGLALAPQTQQLGYADLNNLYGAGSALQTQQQQGINANVAQWNYNQQLPYSMLQQFENFLAGGTAGGTTAVTTPYFSNNLANIGSAVGLGASGAGLLGNLFGGSGSTS